MEAFNNRIKQILLLLVIIFFVYLAIKELRFFLPGLLGALTLYILSRGNYFQLIYNRKWKKSRSAFLFIIFYLFLIGLPVYAAISLIGPKVNALLADPEKMINTLKDAISSIQQKTGINLISENNLSNSLNRISEYIPTLLNNTVTLITNLALMLFILYYMLMNGTEIEKNTSRIIPLKQENISKLASETKRMVKANALGIPLISIIQGLTATLGYFIFGVEEWALWGFLTGIFAFFPIIGTMIIWIPLVIYMYAIGDTWNATGLLLYSAIVTGNVDYLARITLLKRIGNVHPVITILGVIIGLNLFGFIGLIFGPLLVSYIILLFKIYNNEFFDTDKSVESVNGNSEKNQKKENGS